MSSLADVRLPTVCVVTAQPGIAETSPVLTEETLSTVGVVLTVRAVAPVHDARPLHLPRVNPAGAADLLGNLDTLLCTLQPGHQLQISI